MTNQPSTDKPMSNELENIVLNDCNNIVYNSASCNAEAHAYYTELVVMCNNGASEAEVYERLREINTELMKEQ